MWIKYMVQKGRLLGTLAAGLVFGTQAVAQDLGPEWTSLSAEEAEIVFRGPALEDKVARYFRTEHAGYQYTLEVALWTGGTARFPTAVIHYVKLMPGYHFRNEPDPRSLVQSFKIFESQELAFASLRSRGNKLGRIKSSRFSFANVECVGFGQHFGISGGELLSAGTRRIYGYYCADPETPLTDEMVTSVLKGIGVKGEAVP